MTSISFRLTIRPLLTPFLPNHHHDKLYRSSTLSRKVEDYLIDSALIATLLQLLEESQEVPNQRQSRKINREEGQRRLQDLLDCDHNDRINIVKLYE